MILSWAPVDGALLVVGSRQSAINVAWRLVPEAERTPVRRKLIIALVDHIREYHGRTGNLAPCSEPEPACDAWLSSPREPQEVCPCGHYRASHSFDGCHRCVPSLDGDPDAGPEDFNCRVCGEDHANELRHYRTVAGDDR